ncbi:MAG: GNAT family N-acetyltransferase [Erysipelotrichaceae bacterium]|nr:GNAT family N-acetyltransferase [Erysipelotrichaceae bacterium]
MDNKIGRSAEALWKKSGLTGEYDVWSFGDAPDELAFLVLAGIKTATSSAYDCYQYDEEEELPVTGGYSVITDSKGNAVCIIREGRIRIVPYRDIDAVHAYKEGEGDRSLEYYRSVHDPFFRRELAECGKEFSDDSLIVLEEFELVYPRLYLKETNMEDAEEEYRIWQKIPAENGFENNHLGEGFETFRDVTIPKMINYAKGIGLKPEHVPQTCYMLWREKEIVGIFKVRHYLNDVLRNGSGHIGYAIAPEYRGRGYGRLGLRLAAEALQKLPDFAEDEIYMSCYKENAASLNVMLKNGAYIHHEDERRCFTRIPLNKTEGR